MLIGELSNATGVPTRRIRFYEDVGILESPTRRESGYRDYGEDAIHRLRFVRSAKAAGMTLAEIRGILEVRDQGTKPCAHTRALLEDKRVQIEDHQRRLQDLRLELERLIERSAHFDPAECVAEDICTILRP
ncbi:hypothetical protein BH23ACT5_BH23ACT5_22340 [soil metagenome]